MPEYITKPNLRIRFFAGFFDYLIVNIFSFAFTFSYGELNDEGGYTITGLLSFVPILFWFATIVLVEVFLGATLGNAIVGLQPKSLNRTSEKVSFVQSFKRHSLDLIDMFPFGIIGIIAIKNTEKNQRLGDIWANTIVVKIETNKKTATNSGLAQAGF